MRKTCVLIISLMMVLFCTTACVQKKNGSIIKSERRFAQYMEQDKKPSGVVDLSDGPKLQYDKYLGPDNINFDIRSPYE